MKKNLILLAISGLAFFGNQALAVGPGPYAIGQIGQSSIDAGVGNSGGSFDDDDTFFSLGVGFKVTQNLAFELSYNNFGEAKYDYSEFGEDYELSGTEKLELDSFSVAAVGILPLSPSFQLFGKIGVDMWDAEWKDHLTGVDDLGGFSDSDKLSDDGADLFYGIGAAFNISERTDVLVEYQVHSFELNGTAYDDFDVEYDIDADILSVGINYSF
jgi:opacity protein-like surface antigen